MDPSTSSPSLFEPQPPNSEEEHYHSYDTFGQSDHFRKLYQFQQEDALCDVTIVVGGQSFRAHRVVLAASSRYFESMFTSNFKENKESVIKIEGNSYAFGKLLEFAYTSKVKLSKEIVIDVLTLACYMQFLQVTHLSSKFLIEIINKLTVEDVFLLAVFVDRHDKSRLKQLHSCAVKMLSQEFSKFIKTRRFLDEVTSEFLEMILERYDLAKNTTEEQLLSGVIAWLLHDLENRQSHAATLLKKLRLGVIPLEKLKEVLSIVHKHNMTECKKILEHVVELYSSEVKHSNQFPVPYDQLLFTPRNIVTAPFAFGGFGFEAIQYFDPGEEVWMSPVGFPPLPLPKRSMSNNSLGHAAVVVDSELYVAGGTQIYEDIDSDDSPYDDFPDEEAVLLNHFHKFDSVSQSWKRLHRMKLERSDTALVHSDGKIYAIGGSIYDFGPSPTVECYSIADDQWQSIAPMTAPYRQISAVVLQSGKLLVYGQDIGREEDLNSYSFEMYNPVTNVWKKVASEKYHAAYKQPIIMIHDGICYRVSFKRVKTGPSIEDRLNAAKPRINQIDIRELRNGHTSVRVGRKEDQLPLKFSDFSGFCLNGKVFRYLSENYVYNTGINAADATAHMLKDRGTFLCSLLGSETVVTYTFDILPYRPEKSDP